MPRRKNNGLHGFKRRNNGGRYVYGGTESKASIRRDARKKEAAIKVLEYPIGIERQYARYVRSIAKYYRDVLMRFLQPAIDKNKAEINQTSQRTDASSDILRDLKAAIKRAKKFIADAPIGQTIEEITAFGARMDRLTWRRTKKVVGTVDVFTPNSRGVDKWTRENVKLIKTIDKRYFEDIEAVVKESIVGGRSTTQLSALLQERYNVSKSNATRIGRDQIGKLNGQLTQKRQTDLGVISYIWQTAEDDRVRDEHEELDQQEFRWDDPPPAGTDGEPAHPGEAINCRCIALPVLPTF